MHVDISSLYFLSCDLSILHCWCRENMEFECAFHCPRKHIISLPGRIRQIKQLSTQLTKFFQESFWDLICWLKAEDNGIMLWWFLCSSDECIYSFENGIHVSLNPSYIHCYVIQHESRTGVGPMWVIPLYPLLSLFPVKNRGKKKDGYKIRKRWVSKCYVYLFVLIYS